MQHSWVTLCFNSTKVRLLHYNIIINRRFNLLFQFYKSTIITFCQVIFTVLCLVSILQKYDYYNKIIKTIKDASPVSILQKYDYYNVFAARTAIRDAVSILQKYDYYPQNFVKQSWKMRFQFYKSTIITLENTVKLGGISRFQFYKSTIITQNQEC